MSGPKTELLKILGSARSVEVVRDPLTGRAVEIDVQHANTVLDTVLNEPYYADDEPDIDLLGRPKFEVILRRMITQAAKGDQAAMNMVLDRRLGKPKQITESKVATWDMNKFLEQLNNDGADV